MDEYPIDFIPNNSTEYVFTTHIKDPEHFYVHVESQSKILDDIMDELAKRYDYLGPSDRILGIKRLGALCAAKFTDDNNWYRAKITGLMKTGMIEVQFVDYGNTDYVTDERVKSLDPDLVHYPIQCYRCALATVKCGQGYWTPESTVKFEDKAMDQRCEAYFSGKTQDDTYLVYMIDGEGNSLNEMFGAVGASKMSQVSTVEETAFKEVAWQKGSKVQATVAYVQSPDLFWCQDQSYANELLILSEELSRLHMTQGIQPMSDIRPGSICAAKFSEDEAWYRGVVQVVSSGAAQVYFVDYGNTESVPLDLICKLSPGMKTMPALAAKCSLSGVSLKHGSWDQAVVDHFEELVVDKEFEMKIIDRMGDTFIVSLVDIVENTDVSSQMQAMMGSKGNETLAKGDVNSNNHQGNENAGVGPSLAVGSQVETFLTWVDSPGDFWVQIKEFEYLVEKLSNELQCFYAQPRPSTHVSPGAFVVAKYSEDEMWYRGLVLKEISGTEVLVLFIDFGNSDIVSKTDLRQVAPAFGEVVPLAFRCALVGVKSLNDDSKVWTTDAKSFLEEITQDGCICEVVSETESRKLVRLTVNGKDVASELASLRVVAESTPNKGPASPIYTKKITMRKSDRETITVTHVSSPQDFWCQLNKNFAPLDSLMEKLDAHYSDEGGTPIRGSELGRACIAQYSEDKAWYRGKILDASHGKLTVQFVDYGNSEVVSASLVCEPEPRFLDLPIQAVHCTLPLQGSFTHLVESMNRLVLEKELVMEVLDATNDIIQVELYDGTARVSDLLKQISQQSPIENKKQQDTELKQATPITVGTTVTAFTSFVVSPNKFYVQLADQEEELGALMDEISVYNAQNSGLSSLPSPKVNQACMALFSEDSQWYRGIIVSLQGSSCNVLFVDYGNEESVSKDTIRALPPDFTALPALAYECTLEGTDGATWSEEAKQLFESLVMDQELQCTFVSPKSVNILIGGKDVKKELISNGFFKEQKPNSNANHFGEPKPRINGQHEEKQRKDESGWNDSEKADQDMPGFGTNSKSFGNREKNASSGFGSARGDSSSGFGSNREAGSGFGSRGSGSAGFGGGQRERKASSGSATATGEFTYAEPPSEPEKALLVHMDEDGTFYLQLPAMEKDILFLAKRLAGSYKNGGGPRLKDTPDKGVVCCAKFPDDGCMYRCLILDIKGGSAILRYVDYGNTAECSIRDLKMLFPDLLQYPVQAYPCKLKGLTWSIEQAEKFASATLDQDLKVTFSGASAPYEVEVKTPNGDLLDILTGKIAFTPSPPPGPENGTKQKGFGGGFSPTKKSEGGGFGKPTPSLPEENDSVPSSIKSLPSPAPKICEQKFIAQNAPDSVVEAYICHIDEDGYFYLQQEKDTTNLDSIANQLENLRGQHPNPCAGAACAAIFSEDSSCYRALIIRDQGDTLNVSFVDYGNGDEVKKNTVKPLTSALLSYEPLAFKCQFANLNPLPDEAQKNLSAYLMEHKVLATFKSKVSPYNVTMKDTEGNDVQEIICPSDRYRAQPKPKSVVPAGVTHIEDDGRFYLQLYHDFPAIANHRKNLSAAASSNTLVKISEPDSGVACYFESDQGAWCRGQIQKVTNESIEVIDVDIGTSSTKDKESIFKLPLHFFKIAPYAYECRLKGVESWSDDLRMKFTEMTDKKILNATFFTGSAPFRVSLARSIELDLLGLSAPIPDSPVKESPVKDQQKQDQLAISQETLGTQVYISHVDPDGTFYVQDLAQEDDLNAMSEKLEAALASATTGDLSVGSVGSVCCAKFTEDDAWYRALVTVCDEEDGQVSVRFVDYGNTDTVGADRLAVLPEEFSLSDVAAFASKSRLSGVSDVTEEALQKLRDAVLEQVVTVETIGRVEDVDEVVVRVAGTAVTDIMGVKAQKTDTVPGTPAYISHVDPDGTFYVQDLAQEDDLNAMSEKLEAALASATTGDLTVGSVGSVCCAKFTEDDAWYRALVTACDEEDGQVSVRFVDYGNTDTVGADRLAVLPEEFSLSDVAAFARKSRLSGVSDVTEEALQKLRDAVLEQVVTVETIGRVEDVDEVVVRVAGTAVTDIMGVKAQKDGSGSADTSKSQEVEEFVDAPEQVEAVQAESPLSGTENTETDEFADAVEPTEKTDTGDNVVETKEQSQSDTNQERLTPGTRVSVIVSFVVSPSEFYVQLDQEQGVYNALMDQMFEHFSELPEGEGAIQQDLTVGDMCAALYAEDESWYRVIVKGVTEGSYSVFFMDHGNTEVTEADSLRVLQDQFKSLPPASRKATLAGVRPTEEEWSEEAVSEFKTLVEEKSLLADVISTNDDHINLHLLELGIPVHQELIKKGYGVASEDDVINQAVQQIFSDSNDTFMESKSEGLNEHLDTENVNEAPRPVTCQKLGSVENSIKELEDVSVYVSHVTSPSLFWCQLVNCDDVRKELTDKIASDYSDPEQAETIHNACIGDLVIAKNSSDGQFYRSKVLSLGKEEDENQHSLVSLHFIDFGTEGQAEMTSLFKMTDSVMKFLAQAFKCSLENVKPLEGDSWPTSACERFIQVVKGRELSLKLVGRDQNGTSLVELRDPQTRQPLSIQLIESGLDFSPETESSEKTEQKNCDSIMPADTSTFDNLEITHPIMESTAAVQDTTHAVQSFSIDEGKDGNFKVYSLSLHTEYDVLICNEELPNAFHVRLLEMDSQYTSLVAEIQQYIASEPEDSDQFVPSVNESCLVKWNETWHRATIVEREELKWNVKLQDNGREMSVDQTELRKLSQHFLELPAQAIPCYLAGVVSVEPEWCSGAIDFFKDRAKDGKFNMFVLEDAHKGKYGVVISDLESSVSSSVNRVMVDIGYAEVVPGSYIDIQLDMEKTLDTNMLNELEESFNEVSLLKCNADGDEETDEVDGIKESGEAQSYCDSYKESDISKSCKSKVDPHLYQLVEITDNSCESFEKGDSESQGLKTAVKTADHKELFCLALDVEKIERSGCPYLETVDALTDFGGFEEELSIETTEPSSKEIRMLHNEMSEQAAEEPNKMKEKENLLTSPDKLNVEPHSKSSASSPTARETKQLYTWKVDEKNLSAQKSLETEEPKSNDGEENKSAPKGEETGEEISIQKCDINPETNEQEHSKIKQKYNEKSQVCYQRELLIPQVPESNADSIKQLEECPSNQMTREVGSLDEEDSSNKFDPNRSLTAHSELDMEWEDLIIAKDISKSVKDMHGEKKDEQSSAEKGDEVSELSSLENSDSVSEHTPSISPEQDMELKRSSVSETKSLTDLRKRYMSSTPSRTAKTTKAQKRIKSGNVPSSKRPETALFPDTATTHTNITYTAPECSHPPISPKDELFFTSDGKASNEHEEERILSLITCNIEKLQIDAVMRKDVANAQSLPVEIGSYEQKNRDTESHPVEIAEEASIENDKSCSTEASLKEQSVNEATQFLSCHESGDSLALGEDEKVAEEESIDKYDPDPHRIADSEIRPEEGSSVPDHKGSSEKSSLDTTADEYESCSESGLEDSESRGLINSLEAIQGSIALENLTTSSFMSEASERETYEISSFLLSGSSFDTSAVTSDTMSTLEKNDESDDFSSSQIDESCTSELIYQEDIASTSSSASSSCTSFKANTQGSSSTCTSRSSSPSKPPQIEIEDQHLEVSEQEENELCEHPDVPSKDVDKELDEDESCNPEDVAAQSYENESAFEEFAAAKKAKVSLNEDPECYKNSALTTTCQKDESFKAITTPEIKCKDEDEDDAYFEDSHTKSGTDLPELSADEQVLAGAPALDVEDDDTLETSDNEPESVQEQPSENNSDHESQGPVEEAEGESEC